MTTYIIFAFLALLVQYVCTQFDPTTHRAWSLVNEKNCGIRTQQRVVGGQDATLGEFPWVVEIYAFYVARDIVWRFCTGAIISRQFVLTAAHCEPQEEYIATIAAGEFDIRQDPDCDSNNVCAPPVKKYEVEKFIKHPEFVNHQIGRDIALIKIKDEFEFNDFVAPICLEYGDLLSEDYAGSKAEFAGWGLYNVDPVTYARIYPQVLPKITLPVLNESDCIDALHFVSQSYYHHMQDIKTLICAGGTAPAEHIYYGDSGGLLALPKSVGDDIPRYFGIGVCSQTSGEYPRVTAVADIFSKVSFYLPWILDTMADESGL